MSDYGPKFTALSERERAFVSHYVETGGENATQSARIAGAPETSARNEAYRLSNRRRVIEAIREETERKIALDIPEARAALLKVIRNDSHKDHFSAIKLLMGMQGFSPVNKTEHVHTVDAESLADQIKYLEAQLPPALLKRLKPPTIETDYSEVDEDWTAS